MDVKLVAGSSQEHGDCDGSESCVRLFCMVPSFDVLTPRGARLNRVSSVTNRNHMLEIAHCFAHNPLVFVNILQVVFELFSQDDKSIATF